MPSKSTAQRIARRAATSLPDAVARRAAEQAIDGLAAGLAAQGLTFEVAGVTYGPADLFEWCRRGAWAQLTRQRAVVQPVRAGQRLPAWTLEVSGGQASGRKTVTAASASLWEPSEFAVHVYPDRAPMVTMAGSKDAWVAAALLVLDSSRLDFVRNGVRIGGNPSQTARTLLRGWFTA